MNEQLTPEKVVQSTPEALIEHLRQRERTLLDELAALQYSAHGGTRADPRWLAIARTHLEQGFMCAMRAVGKPRG